jgi:hypothetical protein
VSKRRCCNENDGSQRQKKFSFHPLHPGVGLNTRRTYSGIGRLTLIDINDGRRMTPGDCSTLTPATESVMQGTAGVGTKNTLFLASPVVYSKATTRFARGSNGQAPTTLHRSLKGRVR